MIGDRARAQPGFIGVAIGSGPRLRKESAGAQPKNKGTAKQQKKTSGTLGGCLRNQYGLRSPY
eukprot:3310818-Alexandrium_andersonii.AAC.1